MPLHSPLRGAICNPHEHTHHPLLATLRQVSTETGFRLTIAPEGAAHDPQVVLEDLPQIPGADSNYDFFILHDERSLGKIVDEGRNARFLKTHGVLLFTSSVALEHRVVPDRRVGLDEKGPYDYYIFGIRTGRKSDGSYLTVKQWSSLLAWIAGLAGTDVALEDIRNGVGMPDSVKSMILPTRALEYAHALYILCLGYLAVRSAGDGVQTGKGHIQEGSGQSELYKALDVLRGSPAIEERLEKACAMCVSEEYWRLPFMGLSPGVLQKNVEYELCASGSLAPIQALIEWIYSSGEKHMQDDAPVAAAFELIGERLRKCAQE